jgi:tRNA(Ile2) C34 agmatinyltransferase TiaS
MMQKKQIHLASLGAGFLMLGLPSVGVAQTTQLTQNVTTAANPQVVERRWQAHTDKATYEHLMVACQSREFQLSRLNQLQDVATNVVELNRIEVVDINKVLIGENAYAFQQLHASHTKAEHLMLEQSLNNISVIVPNTNNIMKLKQALLNSKVQPKSIIGVTVPDIMYGKVFVFYDSTVQ